MGCRSRPELSWASRTVSGCSSRCGVASHSTRRTQRMNSSRSESLSISRSRCLRVFLQSAVELCRAARLVLGDSSGDFKVPSVSKIPRYLGATEAVRANLGREPPPLPSACRVGATAFGSSNRSGNSVWGSLNREGSTRYIGDWADRLSGKLRVVPCPTLRTSAVRPLPCIATAAPIWARTILFAMRVRGQSATIPPTAFIVVSARRCSLRKNRAAGSSSVAVPVCRTNR